MNTDENIMMNLMMPSITDDLLLNINISIYIINKEVKKVT